MRYVISDIHGKYDLFMRLMDKVGFSDSDTLYVCGDVIDKGEEPIRLLKTVLGMKNTRMIIGNHEKMLLDYYHSLSEREDDFDKILDELRRYVAKDSGMLDYDILDSLDGLPYYIEESEFICVHAGIPVLRDGTLAPLSSVPVQYLLNDRRFKEPSLRHNSEKCVFFGHTQTNGVCGQYRILGYLRNKKEKPRVISDFYKIHLDTGAFCSETLGCFEMDSLRAFYVCGSP